MKKPRSDKPWRGSSLLVILAVISLVTVVVLSLLLMARFERSITSLGLDRQQASFLADFAADTAIQKLRDAIDQGRKPGFAWASEPGRIHVFSLASPASPVSVDMFSALPGPDDPSVRNLANVDLNEASSNGVHLITGNTPGTMKIGWTNLLRNQNAEPSKDNTVVGRFGFWVDDESCKVNINTANGSRKNDTIATMAANQQYNYGYGVPSEISLLAAPSIHAGLAGEIAKYARDNGFNSIGEIGRVAGMPANFAVDHRFDLTITSRTPELNIFGEPRIYLFPVNRLSTGRKVNMMAGPYGSYTAKAAVGNNDQTKLNTSAPIRHVYPTASQLPATPPQFLSDIGPTEYRATSLNYSLGLRIARYLQGFDTQGQSLTWPRFLGSGTGFAAKYSLRQIDSIALQIVDLAAGKNVMADQNVPFSIPGFAFSGFTSGKMVSGVGRSPKLTQLHLRFVSSTADPFSSGTSTPYVKFEKFVVELYFPKHYEGVPLDYYPTLGNWLTHDRNLHQPGSLLSQRGALNYHDFPKAMGTGSVMGSFPYWANNMLRIKDSSGAPAGVDLAGWPKMWPWNAPAPSADPDQSNAGAYHPYTWDATLNKYTGSQTTFTEVAPLLNFAGPSFNQLWGPGVYHAVPNFYRDSTRLAKAGVGSFEIEGGVTFGGLTDAGGSTVWEFAPMDSLRGFSAYGSTESAASIAPTLLKSVIPVEVSLGIPDAFEVSLEVSDPLVNKFPADWKNVEWPAAADVPPNPPTASRPISYAKGGAASRSVDFPNPGVLTAPEAFDGDNPGFRPTGGGDPLSVSFPTQDIRLPKQARFPSIGALNYLRTGIIPDDETVDLSEQHGTPWRSICFDKESSDSQKTLLGRYPDWAMLDLFTVPFLPQDPETLASALTPSAAPKPLRELTSGGATEGKININNPRHPYPFSLTIPGVSQTSPARTFPLESLFQGVQTSIAYTPSGDPIHATVDHTALAAAVQTYLSTNTPFLLPGQLANVPEVAQHTYSGVAAEARSRNDLVRKVIGATTTQSNTFAIWTVAQTIKKALGNTKYGEFEKGDVVTSEVRRKYVVERYIETGKDGVPGNLAQPGPDGIVSTEDDVIDPEYHPSMTYPLPYRWRIVAVEDVTL